MAKARLIQGNQACAEGALAAGVTFFAGYPITPSTEVMEILAEELPKRGGKFLQMEDEIASMGAVCGASLTGVKAITATSGPGFSLKQELIGYAAMAELPVVIVNVQRSGPSTGLPTSPAQGDVMQSRWGTHGDHGILVLSPASVKESYEVMIKAVNFAEKFRTPVIFLLDEVIGHMRERVELPEAGSCEIIDRKVPTGAPADYLAYKPEADGVPPMAPFGSGYRYHVTGLMHGYNGLPNSTAAMTIEVIDRMHTKLEQAKEEITLYTEYEMADAEHVVIAYGGTARSAIAAVKAARAKGIKAGLLKLITIWPFPGDVVQKAAAKAKTVIVPEMNYGQLIGEVERYVGRDKVRGVNRFDGTILTPDEILAALVEATGGAN